MLSHALHIVTVFENILQVTLWYLSWKAWRVPTQFQLHLPLDIAFSQGSKHTLVMYLIVDIDAYIAAYISLQLLIYPLNMYMYNIHMYIYIYVCVCDCVCVSSLKTYKFV